MSYLRPAPPPTRRNRNPWYILIPAGLFTGSSLFYFLTWNFIPAIVTGLAAWGTTELYLWAKK